MDISENDILISAYLDDELTVDERTHVDRLLANSAEARQLLDEMRALRTGLQELPQHKLELDFAHRVLQKAEEIGERPSEGIPASNELDSPSLPATDRSTLPTVRDTKHNHAPRPFGRRGIAWSLIAIAAAVLISITTRSQNENHQAAPGGPPAMVRSPAAPDQPILEKRELAADQPKNVPLEIRAAEKEMPSVANEPMAKAQGNTLQNENSVAESDSHLAESRQKTDRFDQPPTNSLAAQDRDAQNATLGSSSSMMIPAPGIGGGKLSIPDRGAADRARGSELATGAIATTSHAAAAVPQAIVDRFSPDLVVCADMPADAAQRGAFDQVLAKNSISLPVAQQNTAFNLKRSTNDTLRRNSAASAQNGVGNDVDVVYVEAAPEQIQNTLTDLRRSPQIFSAVAVTDVQTPADSKDKMGLQENKSALAVQNDTAGARNGGGQEPQLPAAKPAQALQQSNANLPSLGRAQRIDLLDEAIQPPVSDAKLADRGDDGVVRQMVTGESPAPQTTRMNQPTEPQTTSNKDNSQKQLAQQRAVFLLRIVQPTDHTASESPFPAAAPAMQPSAPQTPAADPAKK